MGSSIKDVRKSGGQAKVDVQSPAKKLRTQ